MEKGLEIVNGFEVLDERSFISMLYVAEVVEEMPTNLVGESFTGEFLVNGVV